MYLHESMLIVFECIVCPAGGSLLTPFPLSCSRVAKHMILRIKVSWCMLCFTWIANLVEFPLTCAIWHWNCNAISKKNPHISQKNNCGLTWGVIFIFFSKGLNAFFFCFLSKSTLKNTEPGLTLWINLTKQKGWHRKHPCQAFSFPGEKSSDLFSRI